MNYSYGKKSRDGKPAWNDECKIIYSNSMNKEKFIENARRDFNLNDDQIMNMISVLTSSLNLKNLVL